ncbi:MAG: hypothetical protein JRI23_31715 [Deltaproteobacteria bacterium]|nr:hypothetical protein [Deltaproteobacteria bacterium]MBW2536789.1 hypothetical protein [Deltaproteobacteria bacterium]
MPLVVVIAAGAGLTFGSTACGDADQGDEADEPCDCRPDGPALYEAMTALTSSAPELAELVDYGDSFDKIAGSSFDGSDLLALHIGDPESDLPKPVLFIVAGHHGNEEVGPAMALRFADWLVDRYDCDDDARLFVDTLDIWIVPTVNPDALGEGRTNANGVDLNRNHSFAWEPGDGHGEGPASEPEVAALEELVAARFGPSRPPEEAAPAPPSTAGLFVSLHAPYSQVLWPWAHTTGPAPNAEGMATLARRVATHAGYEAGQTSQALYGISGCATDWVYGTFGVASLLVEIGPRKAPNHETMDRIVWPALAGALREAARLAPAPYQAAPGRYEPPATDE